MKIRSTTILHWKVQSDRYKALESDQTAFTISDRVQFNDQWSTLLGGKLIHLDEQAYNSDGQQSRDTYLNKFCHN